MPHKIPERETYWESIQKAGYNRRDFMKFVAFMGAYMGIEASMLGQVAKSLETKPRIPIVWLHFQECTCCSESFIRSSHPIVADIVLDKVSLDYTETLMAAAGHQAEAALQATMENYKGEYILCVEGSVPTENEAYCCIGGKSAVSILKEAAAGAKAVIAWGSCASNGCVQAAKPNPTGATPIHKIIKNKTVIKVPGCPPIGEVMAGVVVHVITFDRLPQLDGQGRPKAFYSKRVHDSCYRRPYYDAGMFAERFDGEGSKKGYCLYKLGCRGPVTYNACGITKWNGGVSYPIQSGHGCIGCSENNFWDNGPFYNRLAASELVGMEKSADNIGIAVGAATAVGIGVHAIASYLKKGEEVDEKIIEGQSVEKKLGKSS